jgi:hypothetical protein
MFELAMLEKDINSSSQQGAGDILAISMDITKDVGCARAEGSTNYFVLICV